MRIDDKPIFVIYRPLAYDKLRQMVDLWNDLAKKSGLTGIFFIGYTLDIENEYDSIKKLGVNAVCSCRMRRHKRGSFLWALRKGLSMLTHTPERYNYRKVYPSLVGMEETQKEDVFPTMIPNWDHTPRSGANGYLFTNSTPKLFQKHAEDVLNRICQKPAGRQICFLKSWNEWGEGAMIEPTEEKGFAYLEALKKLTKDSSLPSE